MASSAVAAPLLGAAALPSERTFLPQAVQRDLDAMWSAMLDVGVNLFRTSNRSAVEGGYRQARSSISSPMTVRQAWMTIAPVFGALNDGHVGVSFPKELNDAAQRFPLFFALSDDDDSVIVAGDTSGTIPPGSTLASVNGVPSSAFKELTLAAFGGQTRALSRARVSMAGAWTAIALFGDRAQYTVQYISGGKTMQASISSRATSVNQWRESDPYVYSTLAGGSVGYIDYRSCANLERFQTFAKTTFQTIKDHPVRALIIDIRQNGGGNDALNNVLWSYVADKPFKQNGGMIEKSCARLKNEYGKNRYVEIYGEEAWNAADGTIFQYDMNPNDDLVVPQPQPLRYNGSVYLLTSTHTFSSAMSCALAAKDYGLATIVGEETGEPVNSTGEIYEFTAPVTNLTVSLTTKYFLAPKPHPDGEGVIPDVIVKTKPEDRAAGRDPVLEKALALSNYNSSST